MTDSDSNSSWIMVDDEEEEETEETTEKKETKNVPETREEVEEVVDFWSQIGGEPPQEEPTPLKLSTDKEDKTDVIKYKHELVKYERPNSTSSLTSAGFMILGLFIAIYFGNHYDENFISDIDLSQYESMIPKVFLNKDVQHVETYHQYDHEPAYKKPKKYEYADTKAMKYDDSNKPYKKEYKSHHNDYQKDKYEKDVYKKDYKKEKPYKKQKHSSEEINYKHKKKYYDNDSKERKHKNEKRKRRDWDD